MQRGTLAEDLSKGLQLHQAGRLAEAKQLYLGILLRDPNYADALHLLGVIVAGEGDLSRAIDLISQATRARPEIANYHTNLANVLKQVERFPEAIASYERALALAPGDFVALANLGAVLASIGLRDEAIEKYSLALNVIDASPQKLAPEHREALQQELDSMLASRLH